MTPIDIGLSSSVSSAAQSGAATTGGFSVSGSGNKSNLVTWITLGVVAVVGLILFFKR